MESDRRGDVQEAHRAAAKVAEDLATDNHGGALLLGLSGRADYGRLLNGLVDKLSRQAGQEVANAVAAIISSDTDRSEDLDALVVAEDAELYAWLADAPVAAPGSDR